MLTRKGAHRGSYIMRGNIPGLPRLATARTLKIFNGFSTLPSNDPSKTTTTQPQQGATTNDHVLFKFQKMQNRLVSIPLDEYTPQDWAESKQTLFFWNSRLTDAYKNQDTHLLLERCIQLLDRWVQEKKGPPFDAFQGPVSEQIDYVVNKWRWAWKSHATSATPEQILARVESYTEKCSWLSLNSHTFNLILEGAGHSHPQNWSREKAPWFTQGLLERMLQDSKLEASETSFTYAIQAWTRSGLEEAPHRAEQLLRQAERLCIQPNNNMYYGVIDAWSRSSRPEGARNAQALVEEMEQSTRPNVFPDTQALTSLLFGLSMRPKQDGNANRALGILQTMIKSYSESKDNPIKPNQSCFASVLRAIGVNGQATRAESLLEDMQSLYEKSQEPDFRPDRGCYSVVIDAWSKQGEPNRVRALIGKMQDLAETAGDVNLYPTKYNMTLLIHAYVKQHKLNGKKRFDSGSLAETALVILDHMDELGKSRMDMRPDIYTYGAVIDCVAMSNRVDAARRCEDLLQRMKSLAEHTGDSSLRPNTTIYNTVINAYSRSKESNAAHQAEKLVLEMRTMMAQSDPALKPDRHTYVALITAWARSKEKDALAKAQLAFNWLCEDYTPQDVEYKALLNAWAAKGDVKQVETLIEQIVQGYAIRQDHLQQQQKRGDPVDGKHEDPLMTPSTTIFNILLNAYAKSGNDVPHKGERAEKTFIRMQKLHDLKGFPTQPDCISLGAVLLSWAKSSQENAMDRAEMIFRRSHESDNPKLRPNIICVNTILNGWAKTFQKRQKKRQPNAQEAALRAEQFLMEIWNRHNQRRKLDAHCIRPDKISYTSCMSAWAHSNHNECGERAQRLLDDMIKRKEEAAERDEHWSDLSPDSVIFNTVVKAWRQQGRHQGVDVEKINSKIELLHAQMKNQSH